MKEDPLAGGLTALGFLMVLGSRAAILDSVALLVAGIVVVGVGLLVSKRPRRS